MRTVHRSTCAVTDVQTVDLPGRPIPLSVAPARNGLADVAFDLWYEIDTDDEQRTGVLVHTVGTGMPVPEHGDFIGTIVTPSGLVWHIYVQVPA